MAFRWLATDFGGPEVLVQVPFEPQEPQPGEVTIEVRAAGMNPADYKHFSPGQDRSLLPLTVGYEASGVISAIGPETEIASGGGAVGDEVVAFQILGGYASHVTVKASDVFAKPARLTFAEAANLLMVSTTAAEMLHVTGTGKNDVVLLHGAAGSVGSSALQQAVLVGARVIGTASAENFELINGMGGIPVQYGDGLESRVRGLVPSGITVAMDTVGNDEAIDVSLATVADRSRIVTIAAPSRAKSDGLQWIGGSNPKSGPFRAAQRARLLHMAGDGHLTVTVGTTFPLSEAPAAIAALKGHHPYGKLALEA